MLPWWLWSIRFKQERVDAELGSKVLGGDNMQALSHERPQG
jgi:hypothetical protein